VKVGLANKRDNQFNSGIVWRDSKRGTISRDGDTKVGGLLFRKVAS